MNYPFIHDNPLLRRQRIDSDRAAQIRAHGMEEGDVVLIGGSNTGMREAAVAANSAALELVG